MLHCLEKVWIINLSLDHFRDVTKAERLMIEVDGLFSRCDKGREVDDRG